MKKTLTLIASALVAGLLLSNSACEVAAEVTAEPTEKYLGPSSTQDIEWTSGQDLAIDGRNGVIRVEIGEPETVTVLFEPFTFRGQDEEEEALAEMDTSLVKSVGLNESGDVFVYTQKDGPGSSSLGADMTIRIPPEFDAGIFIEQDGSGDVHIDGVGEAIEIGVLAQGVPDCFIQGAPTVVDTQAWCGAVQLGNVSGHVDVRADFLNGNANVQMASVEPAGADNNIIYTEDGDIVLTLPADESYNVQAWVYSGTGVVNTGDIPSGCEEVVASEASKTVSCGEGPMFDLQAGLKEVGEPVDIELRYEYE